MSPDDFALGVDFGTSHTAAVLRTVDGRIRPVLFDGQPLLPSAVYAGDGRLLVGRDALYAARLDPARLEPYPKQRIDDGSLLLGQVEVPVVDAVAAVLGRVSDEANRVAGTRVVDATLTHPAGWGDGRRSVLRTAAERLFGTVRLMPEPVAAARYFVAVAGNRIAVGASALVYDLGAGTFDAAVVRRTDTGFDVLAADGLPDAGGLDLDATVVTHLGETFGARDAERWERLTRPTSDTEIRAHRLLWEDVRAGREMLSRTTSTRIPVPLFDDAAPLGREQFDELAQPVLERTVETVRQLIDRSGTTPEAVFLVGGGSRTPLVTTLLHRALDVVPAAVEQPELVVAEGTLHAEPPRPTPAPDPDGSRGPQTDPVTVVDPTTVPLVPGRDHPTSPRRRRTALLLAFGATLLAAGAAAGVVWWRGQAPDGAITAGFSPSSTVVRSAAAAPPSPTPSPRSGRDCVVGDWDLVRIVYPDSYYWGTRADMVGTSGLRYSYRADGSGETVITNFTTNGRGGGNSYREVHNGRLTWRFQVGADTLVYGAGGTATGSRKIYVNGRLRETNPMTASGDSAVTFACDERRMTLTNSTYTVELQRRG